MFLKTIRVAGFRNLEEQAAAFSPYVNFICGKNGEGKTNLLEAIYVLSLSKSFRTTRQSELIQWGRDNAAIFGVVNDVLNEISLAVGIEKGGRQLFVNQSRVPSVLEYAGRLITVTFNPADLALIKGAPALRRKFLDKHIADLNPVLMRHLLSYSKALASKTALLQGSTDTRALDSWNVILAQSAHQILRERRALLSRLETGLNEDKDRVGAEDGVVNLLLESNIPMEIQDEGWKGIFEFLRSVATKEIYRRRAIFGPHRDDISIALDGADARAYASQGQTRSLVLSLKLALISILEEQRGESPVLLLDDVDSELDADRRESLFSAVFNGKRQVIITGTDYRAVQSRSVEEFRLFTLKQGILQTNFTA